MDELFGNKGLLLDELLDACGLSLLASKND
jgi:hypothetical protein